MKVELTESHLKELQNELKKRNIKAYYIVPSDPHNSEYVAPYYLAERLYYCPFLGTDGTLLVTQDKAYLFTDGRYFIEAEEELKGSSVELMKLSTPGYPTVPELIKSEELFPLACNLMNVTEGFVKSLNLDSSLIIDLDLGYLLDSRPELPHDKIWYLRDGLCANTFEQKVEYIREFMKKLNVEAHLVTSLNDIAYILNMRGNDIPCTPVFMSFLYIDMESVYLFIDKNKVDGVDMKNIKVLDYNEITEFLRERQYIPTLYNPNEVSAKLANILKKSVCGPNISTNMKCIKDAIEIQNIRRIHILDGIAMVKFIKYLHDHLDDGLTEYQLASILENYRRESKECFELSFTTISAVGSNAAQMHYDPTEEKCSVVTSKENVLLVDSGGQYYGGTTDITRTFILHEPTDELAHDYTLTLKSVIDVSKAIFIDGCTGRSIDMLARGNMWNEMMDYKCGTGHGVGYMLGVHEGPNGFRYKSVAERNDGAKMLPGMITTIEPGVYKNGKYGIRIENELLTIDYGTCDGDKYYAFETVTCCPIDTQYVVKSLLSLDEINYINNYNKWVKETLTPFFSQDPEMVEFLSSLCEEIKVD